MALRTCTCCNMRLNAKQFLEHLDFHLNEDILKCGFCSYEDFIEYLTTHLKDRHISEIEACEAAEQKPGSLNSSVIGMDRSSVWEEDIATPDNDDYLSMISFEDEPSESTPEKSSFISPSKLAIDEDERETVSWKNAKKPLESGITHPPTRSNSLPRIRRSSLNGLEMNGEGSIIRPMRRSLLSMSEMEREKNIPWANLDRQQSPKSWRTQQKMLADRVEGDIGRRIEGSLMLLPGMESIRVAPNLILCQQQKWDESWGCGYRNLQTIVQAILHSEVIRERSGLSRVPRITDIQWDIERAWEAGFDRLDWNNSILGSSAWIGPQEVVTYLRYRWIDAHIINVTIRDTDRWMPEILEEFIYKYYKRTAHPFPIYYQFEGHSCSVIGYATRDGNPFPLIYDPQIEVQSIINALRDHEAAKVNKYLTRFTGANSYQLVVIRGIIRDESHYEINKTVSFGVNEFIISPINTIEDEYFDN